MLSVFTSVQGKSHNESEVGNFPHCDVRALDALAWLPLHPHEEDYSMSMPDEFFSINSFSSFIFSFKNSGVTLNIVRDFFSSQS